MHSGQIVFSQILQHVPIRRFHTCDELLCRQRLSRSAAKGSIQRSRDGQAAGVPDQSVPRARLDDCDAVSRPMDGGTVLQMDQAAPADQTVLWHESQCRQDANLDRYFGVRAGCNYQKTPGPRSEPLQNPTDFKPCAIRQKAHFTGIFGTGLQNRNHP